MKRKENSMSKLKKQNKTPYTVVFLPFSLIVSENGSRSQCLVSGLWGRDLNPWAGPWRMLDFCLYCSTAGLGKGDSKGRKPYEQSKETQIKMSTWWGPWTVPYCTWNPGTDLLPRFTVRSWGSEGWNDSQSHIASKWQRKGFQTQILWLQSVCHSTFQSLPAGVEDPDRSPQSYTGFLMRAQRAHRQKGRGSKGLIRTCCAGPGWAESFSIRGWSQGLGFNPYIHQEPWFSHQTSTSHGNTVLWSLLS